ncbi:MAG TPA: PEP-CTERM sorting domain-containing protein [Candidatus Aquabacterium excrementipullorum]|nr:PEP-CTERM sorting domain-containing protein [Candidatus Aquabacterium excrementipullorum]
MSAAIVLALSPAVATRAESVTWLPDTALTTWWSNGGNWSSGIAPNSGSVDVLIDAGNVLSSVVDLDLGVSIHSVTINAGDTLNTNGNTLSFAAAIHNDGVLRVVGGTLLYTGDATLGGSGQTLIAGAYIDTNGPSHTLTIGSGHTLKGYGYLGGYYSYNAAFVNQGLIRASGGTLSLYATSLDNTAGLIRIDNGAALGIAGGTVTGGTIQSLGSTTITGSGTFADLTIKGGTTLSGTRFSNVTLEDTNTLSGNATIAGTLTNQGAFNIGSYLLLIDGTVTLAGNGQINLSNGYIDGASAGNTLTIGSGQSIKGYGYLGGGYYNNYLALINKGLIQADGGTLYFYGSSLDNSAGQIKISDGATLYASNGAITGGTIESLGTTTLAGGGTFADLIIKGGTTLSGTRFSNVTLQDNNTLSGTAIIAGTLTNKGTLTVGSGQALIVEGDVTLAGAGQISLANGYIDSNGSGNTLTIDAAQAITGYGYLGGGYYNNYVSIANKGLIQASGGTLYFYGAGLDNSAGLIKVDDGAALYASNGTVSGGTVQGTSGNGVATLSGGSYKNLTLKDQISAYGLTIAGTITNQGTLTVNNGTVLAFTGNTTVGGQGQINLANGYIDSTEGSATLTIGSGQTLKGHGYLGGGYYNQYPAFINQGLIQADGGTLYFYGASLNNSTGLIQIADGATFYASNGTITGGIIESLGNTAISGSGTFADLTIKGGTTLSGTRFSNVTLQDDNTLSGVATIVGTLTNKGGLNVGSGQALIIEGDVTVAGAGQINLANGYIDSNGSGNTLTIDTSQTIKGYGYLGGGYYNTYPAIINKGLIQASGGTLYAYASSLDNSAGVIQVDEGATLHAANGAITGGTVQGTTGLGLATLSGGTYKNLTLRNQLNVGGLTVAGTIDNQGTLNVGGGNVLAFDGNTTLGGNGRVNLNGGYIDGTASSTLTIGHGQTVKGYGYLGGYYGQSASLINEGTLQANGGQLQVYNATVFTNRGLVQVDGASTLAVNYASYAQDATAASTVVNGTLIAPNIQLQTGRLSGTGLVIGNVSNTGGLLAPGASPGTLTISGDYAQGSGGGLTIELNGEQQGVSFDWLAITGNASLAGDLYLDVGFTPADGTTFTFLTAGGLVSGAFDQIHATGWDVTTTYTDHSVSVTLTAAVPEPESWALLLAGIAVVGATSAWRRREAEAQPA